MSTRNENMRSILTNKLAVIQVLGCLMNNPLLLADTEYKLKTDDFPERFHRIVFGGIEWLAGQGMEKITPIDLDQFLVRYEVNYKIFCDNQGFEYVTRCIDLADESNFSFYYKQLKKYTALFKFYEAGISIEDFFDPSLTDPTEIAKKQTKLDSTSLEDLIAYFEGKIAEVSAQFACGGDIIEVQAHEGLTKLLATFQDSGDMGEPLMSSFETSLFRGQRLQKLFIESSSTGGGKSRKALGEAARLAIPEYYDTLRNKWLRPKEAHRNAVLYISTELQPDEIQTMLLAYVSGVNENIIRNGTCSSEQLARIQKSIEYIERSKFYFVSIADYDMNDIERLIKKYKQRYNVRYVFFDYLMSTFKMMSGATSKSQIKNLREDQCLLDGVVRLKELANKLNIYIHTATQLNRDYANKKVIDETTLRGAISVADKGDVVLAMMQTRDEDEPIIAEYLRKGFTTRPNLVLHVFKMRQVNQVTVTKLRIYVYFDYGTCRLEDCFVTDLRGEFLDVEGATVEMVEIPTEEELKIAPRSTPDFGGFVL